MTWNSGPCEPTSGNRMLTVTLPSDIWDHLIDRLGDYADQVQERPWRGDCLDCDRAEPRMCPQHSEAAEYGALVRDWRDQIVAQLGAQTSTTADLARRSRLPLGHSLRDLPISTGAYNVLARAGIATVGDLLGLADKDLLKIRNLGPVKLAELRNALSQVTAKD